MILIVAGARPNYMKVAPVIKALEARASEVLLVHTGQHYDPELSDVFFRDLEIRRPDVHLAVGSGSHAVQTARVMERFEPVLLEHRPRTVVVVGDVNSTLACALTAAKITYGGGGRPLVAHVEAGLRSGDWSMPEEVNRVLTDRLSDLLLTPSSEAAENLCREGIPAERIHFVGNVMIDSLVRRLPAAEARWEGERLVLSAVPPSSQGAGQERGPGAGGHAGARGSAIAVEKGRYALVTLHRPSNVDEPEVLERILGALLQISASIPVVFPVHPRTRARLVSTSTRQYAPGSRQSEDPVSPGHSENSALRTPHSALPSLFLLPPLGYVDFLALERHAAIVLTDSGGVQEETTALRVPCLTLRENTERPITVEEGTNLVVGTDPERIVAEARAILDGRGKRGRVPAGWDGKAGERIAEVLLGA